MKKLAIVLAISAISAGAIADNKPMLQKGTQEIGISGVVDFDYVDDYQVVVNGSYGYFLQDNWEVGANLGLDITDHQDTIKAGAFTEYNFANSSQWVPYIGADLQYVGSTREIAGNEFNNDAASLAAKAGVKYFVNSQVAIFAEYNYAFASDDVYVGKNGTSEDTDSKFLIGTRFYF